VISSRVAVTHHKQAKTITYVGIVIVLKWEVLKASTAD
jgi:hypothetical protein